jgi:hypothetical protein
MSTSAFYRAQKFVCATIIELAEDSPELAAKDAPWDDHCLQQKLEPAQKCKTLCC